jgi:uroporphyrinogen-III decarboxylase
MVFPILEDVDMTVLAYDSPNIVEEEYRIVDEWGCEWRTVDKTCGHVVSHPLSSWNKLDEYQFPNPESGNRFDEAKQKLKEIGDQYIAGSVLCTTFERMHFVRGFSNILRDLYENRDKVIFLLKKICDFQVKLIHMWGELGVDGVQLSDDWGTQQNLLINPVLWREIFKPKYKELCKAAHQRKMHVHFHSCGQISKIIPDFIECGIDALEVTQPTLLGIKDLGRDFGGKICFYGCVDKQKTLARGSKEDIRKEAKELVYNLGRFNGGFIAREPGSGLFNDLEALETPLENVKIMYEAFKEYGQDVL